MSKEAPHFETIASFSAMGRVVQVERLEEPYRDMLREALGAVGVQGTYEVAQEFRIVTKKGEDDQWQEWNVFSVWKPNGYQSTNDERVLSASCPIPNVQPEQHGMPDNEYLEASLLGRFSILRIAGMGYFVLDSSPPSAAEEEQQAA